MDWHKLQHTLFEMDPSDPREDLKKLQAQANGGGVDIPPTKDYVNESVEVAPGSMPLGIDSVADFAAFAGVRIDERQKMGSAGQAKGKDPMPSTSKPSTTGEQPHPLKDKLVGEDLVDENPLGAIGRAAQGVAQAARKGFDAGRESPSALTRAVKGIGQGTNTKAPAGKKQEPKVKSSVSPATLNRMLGVDDFTSFQQAIMNVKQGKALNLRQNQAMAQAFRNLLAMDPKATQQVMMLLRRMEATEAQEMPKPRDPNSKAMQDIRKSGAAGAHKDKKKVLPRKEKHKNKQYESIKDQLWAALNAKLS